MYILDLIQAMSLSVSVAHTDSQILAQYYAPTYILKYFMIDYIRPSWEGGTERSREENNTAKS